MSSVDQTDALVPHGVHVLERPGITLIPAPVAEPPAPEPAPTPSPTPQKPPPTGSPPTKHATRPSKVPTRAAKTPTETATKSTAAAYRPAVFNSSIKAQPNSSLIEAAHRQGGTVAHPVKAAASTKPATSNTKKHQTAPGKTTVAVTLKKPVQSAVPAAKHPATAVTPTYHTYKKGVHLKPGQTLAYTPGKGYYARDTGNPKTGAHKTGPHATTAASLSATPDQVKTGEGANGTRAHRGLLGKPAPLGFGPSGRNTSKDTRSLAVSVPGAEGVVGHSNTVHLPSYSYGLVTVKPSLTAEATLKWAKGTGGIDVALNPHTLAISVEDGPLSFSDGGHLAKAAAKWESSPYAAARELLSGKTTKQKLSSPLSASLAVAKVRAPVKFADVEVAAHVKAEGVVPTVEVTVSTSFTKSIPSSGKVTVDYSITADMKLEPEFHLNRRDAEIAAVAAILVAIAAAGKKGTGPRRPPLGPRPVPQPDLP